MITKNIKQLGENIYEMVKLQEYTIADSMVQAFMEELRREFPDYIIEKYKGHHQSVQSTPKILIQVPVQHNEDIVRVYNDLRDNLQIQGGLKLKMLESYDMEGSNVGYLKTDDRHILFLLDIIEYKLNNFYASKIR